jgi:2-O-methyltransferase
MNTNELNWVIEKYYKKENPIFLDIGAHNFHDSIVLKQNVPHASVYAFEPDYNNIHRYKAAAIDQGVFVVQKAMSDKSEVTTFFPANNEASGSIIYPSVKNTLGESATHNNLTFDLTGVSVVTTTLEAFAKENNIKHIDHIHLDVQGAEYKVICGLGEALRPSSIFAETCEFKTYKTNLTLEDFDNLMFEKGYRIVERFEYDTLYTLS